MNDIHEHWCNCDACQPYVPADKHEEPSHLLPFAILGSVMLWTLIAGLVIHWLSR